MFSGGCVLLTLAGTNRFNNEFRVGEPCSQPLGLAMGTGRGRLVSPWGSPLKLKTEPRGAGLGGATTYTSRRI